METECKAIGDAGLENFYPLINLAVVLLDLSIDFDTVDQIIVLHRLEH